MPWDPTPIKGVRLSASGLLALADLSTVAKRTTVTGTSSWLDTFVLVPGLHYQQAADTLVKGVQPAKSLQAHSNTGGQSRTSIVTNAATCRYLQRVGSYGSKGKPINLEVEGPGKDSKSSASSSMIDLGIPVRMLTGSSTPGSIRATLLYLLSAALTIVALVLMVLTRDWWGLGMLCALMVSRVLNIYIIRQRVKVEPPIPDTPNVQEMWSINLEDSRSVNLRGLGHDLQAITTGEWMRAKTTIEGYLEAAAKLIVYLVAAFSGNQHQTGDIILMVLLLSSAGLLALSNADQSNFNMNGRVASMMPDSAPVLRRSTSSAPERLMGKPTDNDLESGKANIPAQTLPESHTM